MSAFQFSGVRDVINANGKMTILGASTVSDTIAGEMAKALQNFFVIDELMDYTGSVIARKTGAEAGAPTSGAAGGIVLSVAALVTKGNMALVDGLPCVPENVANKILIQKGHCIDFGGKVTQMIRLGGGNPVEIGQSNKTEPEILEASIDKDTVALFYTKSHHCVQKGMLSLEKMLEIGKKHQIPVIVDAAAEEDLTHYVALGADLVVYSGGKALAGPTSGFICGKKEYVLNVKKQYKGIGRAMKVSKEAMVGLITALEQYDSLPDTVEEQKKLAEGLATQLNNLKGVTAKVVQDEAGRQIFRTQFQVDEAVAGIDALKLNQKLKDGSPAIYLREYYANVGKLDIDPRPLFPGQEDIILAKIQEILKEAQMSAKVLFNVLAKDLDNALEISKLCPERVLVGVMVKNKTEEEAVSIVKEYQKNGILASVGLGAGDPAQWKKVADVSAKCLPFHVNQVYPAAGYTLGKLADQYTGDFIVNSLLEPAEEPGKVYVTTGPNSQENKESISCKAACKLLSDIGLRSVKFYPIEGLKKIDHVQKMVEAAVAEGIEVFEPTGGIGMENVHEIVDCCVKAGAKIVIPHLYTSLIDDNGNTRPEFIKELLDMKW